MQDVENAIQTRSVEIPAGRIESSQREFNVTARTDLSNVAIRNCLTKPFAEALAAERVTPAQLAEIRALHYEMLAAFTRRDLPTYYRLNALIHTHINAAAVCTGKYDAATWAKLAPPGVPIFTDFAAFVATLK